MLQLQFKKLHENAKLPTREPRNIGWDLYVVRDESFRELPIAGCGPKCTEYAYTKTLMPGQAHIFHTGVAAAIPDGYGALLWDRSGMGAIKKIHRLAGVIDSSYRGEWLVALINLGGTAHKIYEGDRIVQFILQEDIQAESVWVDELDDTERGNDGFGSSGR